MVIEECSPSIYHFPYFGNEFVRFNPRIDLVEVNGNFEVTAELPGMDADDVELTVAHDPTI
jgi:HSP20 family molecular chaperone IbpA